MRVLVLICINQYMKFEVCLPSPISKIWLEAKLRKTGHVILTTPIRGSLPSHLTRIAMPSGLMSEVTIVIILWSKRYVRHHSRRRKSRRVRWRGELRRVGAHVQCAASSDHHCHIRRQTLGHGDVVVLEFNFSRFIYKQLSEIQTN